MSQANGITNLLDSDSALNTISVIHSSRSSITYAEYPAGRSKQALEEPNKNLLTEQTPSAIASRAEEDFERYGGNDIHDPPPRTPKSEVLVPTPDMKDPNLVDWDGPGDQENPQNWSLKYKWFITFLCILMTVNVCVFHTL
jgi:DHA1 family multidrug resistance protein-like MFS transporter